MVQTIRIKRNVTTPNAPTTLDPGELSYTKNGHKLYVGDDTNTVNNLVSADRQMEIHANSPVQTVDGGAKTFPLAKLKVPGGNVGEFLSISAADGTLVYQPMVSASQQFVGSLDATAGTVTFTTQSGHPGPGLPAPAVANNGHYVIADTAGATPPAGAPAGNYNIGDWVISNGVAWTHLSFGGIETDMAAEIGVVAPVTGGTNVQEVLESMQTDALEYVSGPATSTAGFIATYADATGKLIATGIDPATLPTKTYVDAENDAQDLIIAANAAFVAAQPGVDGAQDTAINNKITKPASVAAIGNIATYADVGGVAALDGGKSIADIDASIALKADAAALAGYLPLAGGTVTGPIILPVAAPTTDPEAANKKYVDDQINSIPGATPPEVTAPELTGNGTTLTPITFTGITAETLVFGGKGLSTDPLTLLLVDGGVYT
jgi:hypothetical protein